MIASATRDRDRDRDREARRQQWLLRTLWCDAGTAEPAAWLGDTAERQLRGLQAYRINAAASAERALASAYPTVAALVGPDSFAAMARDLWRRHPPERGDLAEWGAALPAFVADSAALACEPYLADSAQLDWLVHGASRAADAPAAAAASSVLAALGDHAPEALRLSPQPGSALLVSAWPVASVWRAHQRHGEDRFDDVRAAFAAGRAEAAFVWRDAFVVRVDTLDTNAAAFTQALLGGATLAAALDAAGEAFAFDQWLVQALQQHWLAGVQTVDCRPT